MASKVPQWVRDALPRCFVLEGVPVSKKNSKNVVPIRSKKTGRVKHVPLSNPGVRSWEKRAVEAFKEQWGGLPPIPAGVRLHAKITSFQGPNQSLDLSNSYEAPQDALQKAGVIFNDYWIESHDGSRKLRDVARPRVVIVLSILEEP